MSVKLRNTHVCWNWMEVKCMQCFCDQVRPRGMWVYLWVWTWGRPRNVLSDLQVTRSHVHVTWSVPNIRLCTNTHYQRMHNPTWTGLTYKWSVGWTSRKFIQMRIQVWAPNGPKNTEDENMFSVCSLFVPPLFNKLIFFASNSNNQRHNGVMPERFICRGHTLYVERMLHFVIGETVWDIKRDMNNF